MKNIVVLWLLVALQVFASPPNFDTDSRIVTFPKITVNNNITYLNVELLLNVNGTWKILAAEPENTFNLTGDWQGSSKPVANFGITRPCSPYTDISFIQKGTRLTGSGEFIIRCSTTIGDIVTGELDSSDVITGIIAGFVQEENVSFSLISDKEIINYEGTISNDFQILTLIGPGLLISAEEKEIWSLELDAFAFDSNFDTATNIISSPIVTINNNITYLDTQVLLDPNGTWEVLGGKLEDKINLTGDWSGSFKGSALINMETPLDCAGALTDLSLVQDGNNLRGVAVFVGGCINGGNGKVTGRIDGSKVFFKISMDDDTIFSYEGNISSTHNKMGGTYAYVPLTEKGTWSFSR